MHGLIEKGNIVEVLTPLKPLRNQTDRVGMDVVSMENSRNKFIKKKFCSKLVETTY